MKLLRATAVFSAMTLLSRLTGYARDVVQAGIFGVSGATDAFFVAYRIPNFLRRIFAEGSFSQAFVPVFAELKHKGDRQALKEMLDHVAGALCAIVMVVAALGMLLAPLLARLFAPGAAADPAKLALTGELLRITFPYLVFISLAALAAGVLNTFNRFAVPAVSPVLHNLAIIAAALWLAPLLEVPIKALAYGVLLAGLLQFLLQWLALSRLGILPRPKLDWRNRGVRRVLGLMLPTIFGASVAQINLLLGTVFASLLVTGSQTWLYLTDRLLEFPQGLFGAALGTVVLPALSRCFASGDEARYSATLDWGLRWVCFIAFPACIGLVLFAEPINAALYQYGKFTAYDTRMAALSLMALSVGLPGFMLAKIIAPAFYARQDARTPVRAALVAMLVNIVLCAGFVGVAKLFDLPAQHVGIALATALAGNVNALMLFRFLRARGWYQPLPVWGKLAWRLSIACAGLAATLFWLKRMIGPFAALAPQRRISYLLASVLVGMAVYLGLLLLSGFRFRDMREAKE